MALFHVGVQAPSLLPPWGSPSSTCMVKGPTPTHLKLARAARVCWTDSKREGTGTWVPLLTFHWLEVNHMGTSNGKERWAALLVRALENSDVLIIKDSRA